MPQASSPKVSATRHASDRSTVTGPLASIGVTVYNAERFLEETLESIRAFDYPNMEIVITDNASQDRSSEICRRFERADPRIQYYRNSENIGAVKNWNRALELATGTYFMWAADHDLWDPTFVTRAVRELERSNDVELVYPQTQLIGEHGEALENLVERMDTTGMTAVERFRQVVWNLKRCNMLHGVWRTSTLKMLGGFPNAWAMDTALIPAVALCGEFLQLEETMFFRRENRPGSRDNLSEETKRYHVTQLDPEKSARRSNADHVALRRETRNALLRLIWKCSCSPLDKLQCSFITLNAYWARYHVGYMGLQALRHLLPGNWRRKNRGLASTS